MERSDTQPDEEITSANTEINALTDKLEVPVEATPDAPVKDVQTFWTRLDSLMTHLEESNQHKSKDKLRSFTNQPERVCISSDNDINTSQTQDAINEQSFDSFRVAIKRPFLDVKSIQLLRASIPNTVTNIPDTECVFWYYRIPTATFNGTVTMTTAPTYSLLPITAGGNAITGTTDIIRWDTVPYSVCNSAGIARGYFFAPSLAGTSVNVFESPTLTGTVIGSVSRNSGANSGLYMPAPSYQYLHMIRLLPSTYKVELFDAASGQDTDLPPNSSYGWNKTFTDYQDLASELFKSCQADPAYDSSIDAGLSFPLFIPNDITLSFNQTLNKFIFTGNNAFVTVSTNDYQFATYLSAGFEDPILWNTALANTNSSIWFLTPISAPQLFIYTASPGNSDFNFIYGAGGQPYQQYRTLNLRLGFTWNGLISQIAGYFPVNIAGIQGIITAPSVITSYYNRLRPVPEYIDQAVPPLLSATTPYLVKFYTADSYANLVYTNTVSLYADFTGGSTYDSMANTQLLACVPMNASNLGVTFYNTTLYCPLTKISDQIYEIEIRMLTDTGVPYVIPNSAIVSLELALTY
jgi:hypothetical protein